MENISSLPAAKAELSAFGISKTVYSLCPSPVRRLLPELKVQLRLDDLYETWTGKQDAFHEPMAQAFCRFISPAISFDRSQFPFFYPCAGSSEAIRESIALMASQNHSIGGFEGEYEGYEAIARALGARIVKIPRRAWKENIHLFAPEQRMAFFISQPSAINGFPWNEFDAFTQALDAIGHKTLFIDMAYAGLSYSFARFNAAPACAQAVFFSLSKSFGLYCLRAGGAFTRAENPLLFGNIWFKNIQTIQIAQRLFSSFGIFDLPELLRPASNQTIRALNERHGFDLIPSGCPLLAATDHPFFAAWRRAPDQPARVCITPALERSLFP